VKQPVTDRATRIFDRVEAALDVADEGLDHVQASLARAAERLESVREEQRRLAQEPRRGMGARRFMARTVQQQLAPDLGNAHDKLHTVAEAAAVVNSVLEDVGNFPFLSAAGLDVGDLSDINRSLSQVESTAWELTRLLGEPAPDPGTDDVDPALSRIERALQTMQGKLAGYRARVVQVRQRVEELRSRTLNWITPGAVILSFLCFWIALSQVSLLSHACSWWRHAGRKNP
jgi:hypothetical protein